MLVDVKLSQIFLLYNGHQERTKTVRVDEANVLKYTLGGTDAENIL